MRDELTELEHCVLGVIWHGGPMTAYEVASTFSMSLSPYWSGSAGAIYPVVKRLQTRKLLQARMRAWKGSRKTMLSTTRAGEEALRAWFAPPLPPEAGAPAFDPVRTRVYFLDVLPAGEREAFLDEAERVVKEQLRLNIRQREENERDGEELEALGALGAIYELRARQQWLRKVRKHLRA